MGFAAAVPLIAAGIGAASSIYSSNQQASTAKKARRLQEDQMRKQELLQRKEQEKALTEQQKLQIEESDAIRATRRRGRRSLISGNEQGVDLLGQRIGGLNE